MLIKLVYNNLINIIIIFPSGLYNNLDFLFYILNIVTIRYYNYFSYFVELNDITTIFIKTNTK